MPHYFCTSLGDVLFVCLSCFRDRPISLPARKASSTREGSMFSPKPVLGHACLHEPNAHETLHCFPWVLLFPQGAQKALEEGQQLNRKHTGWKFKTSFSSQLGGNSLIHDFGKVILFLNNWHIVARVQLPLLSDQLWCKSKSNQMLTKYTMSWQMEETHPAHHITWPSSTKSFLSLRWAQILILSFFIQQYAFFCPLNDNVTHKHIYISISLSLWKVKIGTIQ